MTTLQTVSALFRAFGQGLTCALFAPGGLVQDYHRATRR